MSDTQQILLLIAFLCLSAFFSASETALMSLSRIRLRHMVDEGIKGADLVQRLVDNPSRLLGAILLGNNIVNIGASALATSLAIKYFGNTGVGIATGIMTILVLIFGEITPKSLAAGSSEKVALKVARFISIVTMILNPIITVLINITNLIILMLGGKVDRQKTFFTVEEIKTMINVSHEEGVLEEEEKKLIHNVFEFGDLQVSDVMTPRTDIVAIKMNSSYDEIAKVFKENRFSRLPIYQDKIDKIIGVVHLRDLIFCDLDRNSFDINNYIKEAYFTYEFKGVADLFAEMRSKKAPFAIALDEYGGTAGIVTMDDLVQEIVGDIRDEYDKSDIEVEIINANEYIVKGTAKIEVINEVIGLHIESENFDSIGGFAVGLFGRLPKAGEYIEYENIRFVVNSIDKNRIENLKIML